MDHMASLLKIEVQRAGVVALNTVYAGSTKSRVALLTIKSEMAYKFVYQAQRGNGLNGFVRNPNRNGVNACMQASDGLNGLGEVNGQNGFTQNPIRNISRSKQSTGRALRRQQDRTP